MNTTNQTGLGPIRLSATIVGNNVFSYNNAKIPMVYSQVSYSTSNATNATIYLDIYEKAPFQKIYLVNVTGFCVSCFDSNAVRNALEAELQSYDLLRNSSSFNYIALSELGSVPSNSTVIVPSGLLPASLLNDVNTSIFRLLEKGNVVIYIGLNFSKSLGPNGLIFVSPPEVIVRIKSDGLDTISATNFKQLNVSVANATDLTFNAPSFAFTEGRTYANVTYVNSQSGTMLAFSNYPTSSWSSPAGMASDLAKVINARFWMRRIGHSETNIDTIARESGILGVFAVASTPVNATNTNDLVNKTHSLVTVIARNLEKSGVVEVSFKNKYDTRSTLSISRTVGETQNIPITIQVGNASSAMLFHMNVYDSDMGYVSAIPIGFISSAFGVVKYHAFSLPSGYYILSLKDFKDNNYANTFFYLDNATITPMALDFKNGTFAFSIYSNNVAVTNATHAVNLNGAYGTSGVIEKGALLYSVPKGTMISYGEKKFNIRMFNTNYTYSTLYEPNVILIPPIYIEIAITIILVVVLNLILKPPNRDEYYIDVPEFPPSKRERIKVSNSVALGVFDKVNYYYHWKYMPLTIDEMKTGVGNNIRINNMPIAITTQNTNMIAMILLEAGQLVSAAGYYAPKTWIEASGHDIEYLTIFRRLRDYCVSHAILFTDLDGSQNSDMLMTKDTKQTSVFIYSSASKMRNMTLSKESRVAIVFLNDEIMRDFVNKLYASLGKEAEILRMGVEYNYIRLVDANHLNQLVL